ncbi:F-box/kelch-repeat protein At3g23880-like isoform X1 [Lycium barbarum]|uniref:F-box/kelch-repeat protein At3g23880-like isoform X1 n=1 Tax=Lycium barbarum TaxID=112863 RepID=UPI00293EF73A|nr:F-box/kelch-repeat protein At3g23880-like isoform X1 [Lycium barbarum]XP_060199666.1 F-box/kelch-repeat protein At3g23880-like isoform X1 [Lycium barbarum]XP_060199667.1 F-box/kelch-repeat protein At3g23880-like isoform X1 [Lycium barbarum]
MAASDNRRAFPDDLAMEILVRLPVKSLLRFKCACKNWYALIKSPSFIQQHLNCSKNKVLIYDYGAPDDDDDSPPISLIILDDQNQENNPQRFRGMAKLLGSVDGLFYLECEFDRKLVSCALWNPATREVRPLPLPAPETDDSNFYGERNFGFGLDPLTNDYKVVHFCPSDFAAAVYSCSRDSWRIFRPKEFYLLKIKDVADRIYGNAYLNGAYYWLLTGYHNCNILSFDFGSEVFEEIGGPDDHSVHYYAMALMLLDDSIAILNMVERFDFDIWIMIQPGVWNKLLTFQCCTKIKSCFDSSLILVTRAFRLVSYNVLTKKTRHLGFRHLGLKKFTVFGGCGVYCYKESLVAIKRGEVGH